MKPARDLFLPDPKPLDTVVLVLDQSNTLSFAAATDPMRAANRKSGAPLFRWRFATAEGEALEELDVNPLICRGDDIVAVDALIIPAAAPAAERKAG